jgi:Domain of unknown function (DUF4397)
MRHSARFAQVLLLSFIAACGDSPTAPAVTAGLRVINAFTTPVDIVIDGTVVASALTAGSIDTIASAVGVHSLTLRPTGAGAPASQSISTTAGALNTVAAVRVASGALGTVALDDTNSIVPAGATKVRVLHFAPNAGTLQVYRTQPDYQQPISWQFPFNYQPDPNSLSAPFLQSTVGSWEVRVWQTPADASGWATATVRVVIPLGSGEKKTVLMLDKAGGGVRIEVL